MDTLLQTLQSCRAQQIDKKDLEKRAHVATKTKVYLEKRAHAATATCRYSSQRKKNGSSPKRKKDKSTLITQKT